MTLRPTVITPATSVRDAAQIMTRSHFRHLPVYGDSGLAGIINITDICRALLALAGAEGKETLMTTSVVGLSIDCADAAGLARFWSEVLGRPVNPGVGADHAAI